MGKNGGMTSQDFVSIPAGATVQRFINVGAPYELSDGQYQVSARLTLSLSIVEPIGNVTLYTTVVVVPPYAMKLVGYVSRPAWADEKFDNVHNTTSILHTTSVTWVSCSSSQQATVNTAIQNAKTQITNCRNYFGYGICDSAYVRYFGSYIGSSPSRWNTVKTTFANMDARINSAFSVNCAPANCGIPPCYAYVYPTDASYTIYLCGKTWAAPADAAMDTQWGVLVHELSHFSTVGYTNDYQYGLDACLNLAKVNPTQSVANADSHEYFAEYKPVRCY